MAGVERQHRAVVRLGGGVVLAGQRLVTQLEQEQHVARMVAHPGRGHGVGLGSLAGLAQAVVQARGGLLRIGLGHRLAQRRHRLRPALLQDLHLAFEQVADGLRRPLLLDLARHCQRLLGLLLAQRQHHLQALGAQVAGLQVQHPLQAARSAARVVGSHLCLGQAQVTRR